MTLYTSGYEGEKIGEFLSKLQSEGISVVIDIRENPVSRKPGFGKLSLKSNLEKVGIEYLHYQELGTPKPLRDWLKTSRDYKVFFEEYSKYLEEYRDSILDIAEIAMEKKVCILCFEHDVHMCHRFVVSEMVEHYSHKKLRVEHL